MKTALTLLVLIVAIDRPAWSQVLSVTVTNSMSSFSLTSDPTPTQPLTVRTDWNRTFSTSLSLCAYMSSPMNGTGTNTDTIPQSSIQFNGTSITSNTVSCGTTNGRQLWSSLFVFGSGSRDYTANVSLGGYPSALSPDTYTGTITFVATAF